MVRTYEVSDIELIAGSIDYIADKIMALADNFDFFEINKLTAECRKKVGFDSHKRTETNRAFEKRIHDILKILMDYYGYEQAILIICVACDVDIKTIYNNLKRYYKLKNGKITIANRKDI